MAHMCFPSVRPFISRLLLVAGLAVLAVAVPARAQEATGGADTQANELLVPRYSPGGAPEIGDGGGNGRALRFIAMRNDPPFVFERRDLVLGLYVEVVRQICELADFACVLDLLPREEVLAEDLGENDVLIAALSDPAEHAGRYDFTQPLLQNPGRVLVRRDSPLTTVWPEDLQGARFGVVQGLPSARFAEEELQLSPAASFGTLEDGLAALQAGSIDALFADGVRLNFFLAGEAGGCCRLLPGAYIDPAHFREQVIMAVAEGNAALRQRLAAAMEQLTRNETRWGEIYLKYFPFGLY